MLDIGVTKLAIIGGIALVVIGPERLPGLARTAGTLLGRARRYVADVKEEVNRSMELEALKKMRDSMETAARDVEQSIQTHASDFEKSWSDATQAVMPAEPLPPVYRHPGKKWRIKIGSTPRWYKVRHGVRSHALSASARVARYRPARKG